VTVATNPVASEAALREAAVAAEIAEETVLLARVLSAACPLSSR
jgi:hypothetical protein